MSALITICVPTCDRPDLLALALRSCFAQTYRPLEILVGDDSRDDASGRLVAGLAAPEGIRIRYRRNAARRGQSANVNALFADATGDRLVLLHDDDLLAPDAVAALDRAFAAHPGTLCAYGKQEVVADDGRFLEARTRDWNHVFHRRPDRAGPQISPVSAGLLQQMPSDGFLIATDLARRTGLRPEAEIGHCVDADFGIRAGIAAPPNAFVYLDRFLSSYRLTLRSVTTAGMRQDLLFEAVRDMALDPSAEEARDILLTRIASGAALDAARAGRRRAALAILASRHYRSPLLSRWTLYRLACIASPAAARRVRALVKRAFPSLREGPDRPRDP